MSKQARELKGRLSASGTNAQVDGVVALGELEGGSDAFTAQERLPASVREGSASSSPGIVQIDDEGAAESAPAGGSTARRSRTHPLG
jgi:hypothetical protein